MTEQALDRTSHQPLGYIIKIDEVISQVKHNSIRADPDKRLSPFPPLPDLDHLVKKRQQQAAIPACNQDICGGPDFPDNGEL